MVLSILSCSLFKDWSAPSAAARAAQQYKPERSEGPKAVWATVHTHVRRAARNGGAVDLGEGFSRTPHHGHGCAWAMRRHHENHNVPGSFWGLHWRAATACCECHGTGKGIEAGTVSDPTIWVGGRQDCRFGQRPNCCQTKSKGKVGPEQGLFTCSATGNEHIENIFETLLAGFFPPVTCLAPNCYRDKRTKRKRQRLRQSPRPMQSPRQRWRLIPKRKLHQKYKQRKAKPKKMRTFDVFSMFPQ